MLRLWLVMTFGATFLVASGVIASLARAQPNADVAGVITAFETARNAHDLDTALSYFADNAVISQRNTNFTGKDEIRKYLDTVSSRTRFVVVSDRHVTGNVVSWTERTQPLAPEATGRPVTTGYNGGGQGATGAPGFYGRGAPANQGPNTTLASQTGLVINVEAVVQDGKIQSLSYIFGGGVPRVDPAQDGRNQLPAGIGLAAVVVVLLGVLSIASLGFSRPEPSASRLQGRLMQDLQGWAAGRQ